MAEAGCPEAFGANGGVNEVGRKSDPQTNDQYLPMKQEAGDAAVPRNPMTESIPVLHGRIQSVSRPIQTGLGLLDVQSGLRLKQAVSLNSSIS
jgi:hypothetical protein